MQTRQLGADGPPVGAVGLGCMGMSWAYSERSRDDDVSIAVIRAALDHGVTLLDTADVYGGGHNEELVGRGVAGRRNEAVLATKVGLVAGEGVAGEGVAGKGVADQGPARTLRRDARPEHIKSSIDDSLRRLRTDVIDLYYLHRIDPEVPLEESWGTLSELVKAGKARRLGLSEVTVEEASRAHAVHPVAAVQSEFSLWTRDPLNDDVVGWCEAVGAAFVPFAPLGRGYLTGAITASTSFDDADFRAANPRFADDARSANQHIVDVVRSVAARHRATPAQVAIAWVLAQGKHVLPIPGTKQRRYLDENVDAADVILTAADLTELDELPQPVGARY